MTAAAIEPPARAGLPRASWMLTAVLLWPSGLQAHDACTGMQPEATLAELNAARAQGQRCSGEGPLQTAAPVRWSPPLARAAQQQADWLSRHGPLVHVGPRGESLAWRVAAAGYRQAHIRENLAAGQNDVPGALRAWAASLPHCRSLVDPVVTEAALACATAPDGEPFWVLLLGRPQ